MSAWIVRLERFDERLLRALLVHRRPLLDALMRGLTHLADWPVAVALTLSLALGLVPPLAATGQRMAWTLALAHLAVEVLKRCFTRERPNLGTGMQWLVGVPDRFSFPSGHATAAMSMALPLFLFAGGPFGVAVLTLGAAVGLSRCYLGVHYPGDVAAGWLLAATTCSAGIALGG
jgi:undecaprenyl-diphosphatase